jgi:hypothetical protein
MTTHDPILDGSRAHEPGCLQYLVGLAVFVVVLAASVAVLVGAAALAYRLWRVLT